MTTLKKHRKATIYADILRVHPPRIRKARKEWAVEIWSEDDAAYREYARYPYKDFAESGVELIHREAANEQSEPGVSYVVQYGNFNGTMWTYGAGKGVEWVQSPVLPNLRDAWRLYWQLSGTTQTMPDGNTADMDRTHLYVPARKRVLDEMHDYCAEHGGPSYRAEHKLSCTKHCTRY